MTGRGDDAPRAGERVRRNRPVPPASSAQCAGRVGSGAAGLGSTVTASDRPTVVVSTPGRPVLGMDVLGSPVAPERRRDWRAVLAAVVGVAGVGVAGVGIALAVALGGGGPQPEDALPADVFALAKVDLDPAAGQKIAAYELAKRFPQLEVEGARTLQDDLLRRLFTDSDIDYDAQVRPWIGARAALAGAPDADGDGAPELLVALAYDDRDAAERLLPALVADGVDGDPAFFAFSSRAPYVLLAQSQAAADAAAGTDRVLGETDRYRDAVAALGDDQVALGWADLEALWAAVPQEAQAAATEVYGDGFRPRGSLVAGVHLESDAVEMTGRGFGLDLGSSALTAYALGADAGDGLVRELPADAVAAMSVAGLGGQVEDLFELLATARFGGDSGDLDALERELGIAIPEDLALLLGNETAAGIYDVDGNPEVGVRTRGDDPAGALAVAQRLMDKASEQATSFSGDYTFEQCARDVPATESEELCGDLPSEDELAAPAPFDVGAVTALPDGIAYATDQRMLDQVTASGGLGDSEMFRRAVPGAADAATVMFADLQAVLALFGDEQQGLEALEAIGATSTGGADGRFSLRLTVR